MSVIIAIAIFGYHPFLKGVLLGPSERLELFSQNGIFRDVKINNKG